MITEREKKALQLAKKAYGHFTQDALSIAKEIIALEREMADEQDKPVTIPSTLPIPVENRSIDPKTLQVNIATDAKTAKEVNSIRIAGPAYYPARQTAELVSSKELEPSPY